MMLGTNRVKKDTLESGIQGEVEINGQLGIFGRN